jgi:hypothetical protein
MKKIRGALALAGCVLVPNVHAITTNDIQLWTGSGTNRAALVIEWNSPEVFNNSTVPTPIANKTMVWGYQFNGAATGTEMLNAVLMSDHRLYAVISNNNNGTFVDAIGYNLNGNGVVGVTDGSQTYNASAFTNGYLLNPNLNVDGAYPLNSGDLYWGGYYGPNWNLWTELNDEGGFGASPNRGTNQYWNTVTGIQGQWEEASDGLDGLPLYDGSWIGFSVAAAGYDGNSADPAMAAYYNDEQAPPSPDGTYVAYVVNTNDFAIQVVSFSGISSKSPYNDPSAVLGRPTLTFFDVADGGVTNRTSIIDPPYNVSPGGGDVITEITNGGQITVMMGRKVYHDPSHPYGVDLIVFGNSFFSAPNAPTTVSDLTDLDSANLGGGTNGHPTTVSVSPDGTNWFTFSNAPTLFPANAYRWDDANQSWTDEQLNPTKPLNPSVYETDFAGLTVASALDLFSGSAGGTGYNLEASGFPWIQYVRVEPGSNSYTVIDAIAAVNPVVEGDTVTIAPGDITLGMTNLAFQVPDNISQTLISLNFNSVSDVTEIGTVGLSDFSSFAPVPGKLLNAFQISATAVSGAAAAPFLAEVGLSTGSNYTGNGSDLRVLQWNGASWSSDAFSFSATNQQVWVAGLTNLSAFVVAQISAPVLSVQMGANGLSFQFTPFANLSYTLRRSTDLRAWTSIKTLTAPSEQPLTMQDPAPPASYAFYRLLVNP